MPPEVINKLTLKRASNNTVLLMESKYIDFTPNNSDWNDKSDPSTCTGMPLPPLLLSVDNNNTTPKTINQTDSAFGGAQRKTGFLPGFTRSTAVISGHPAGSEDGEFED